jgi:hypothetical protein
MSLYIYVYSSIVATADYIKLLNNGRNFTLSLCLKLLCLCRKFKYVDDMYLFGNFHGLKKGSSNYLLLYRNYLQVPRVPNELISHS